MDFLAPTIKHDTKTPQVFPVVGSNNESALSYISMATRNFLAKQAFFSLTDPRPLDLMYQQQGPSDTQQNASTCPCAVTIQAHHEYRDVSALCDVFRGVLTAAVFLLLHNWWNPRADWFWYFPVAILAVWVGGSIATWCHHEHLRGVMRQYEA